MTTLGQILFRATHTYPRESKKRWLVTPPKNQVALFYTYFLRIKHIGVQRIERHQLTWNKEQREIGEIQLFSKVGLLLIYDVHVFQPIQLSQMSWEKLRCNATFWRKSFACLFLITIFMKFWIWNQVERKMILNQQTCYSTTLLTLKKKSNLLYSTIVDWGTWVYDAEYG